MNLIFEFIGMYLMMGVMAYGIYFIVGIIYLLVKLSLNWSKAQEFFLDVKAETGRPKNKISHWLGLIFLWPYAITMGSYRVYSTVKKITT